jgi:transcriptional regulator GlxA family with amidase domain
MLQRVAVVVLDRVSPFELGVVCEVFGTDRSIDGFPRYEFSLCTPDGRPVRTSSGFTITPDADLAPLETADLVAVPAHPFDADIPEELKAGAAAGGRARGVRDEPVLGRVRAR